MSGLHLVLPPVLLRYHVTLTVDGKLAYCVYFGGEKLSSSSSRMLMDISLMD